MATTVERAATPPVEPATLRDGANRIFLRGVSRGTCVALRGDLDAGSYRERTESLALPCLSGAELIRFLEDARGRDETTGIRAFRARVRAEPTPRFARPGP